MSVVVDASLVVAALTDTSSVGRWAEEIVLAPALAAPHLLPAETANVLRRAELAGLLSSDATASAHSELLALRLRLVGYSSIAERAWELRRNVTSYDAWYVALAERLGVPLATTDERLTRASGPRCEFLTPPEPS